MRGFKQGNNYVDAISFDLYQQIPKAVWAAIAISFAQMIQDENWDRGHIETCLLNEWAVLHREGIVPQRPARGLSGGEV